MISREWTILLDDIFKSEWFKELLDKVNDEYKKYTCFPPSDLVFNALKLTPLKKLKVVILGQDPYHGTGEAHGLSFSVMDGVRIPPSLKNIFKELNDDLGIEIPKSGDLSKWANDGVLLLNSALTVRKDSPASHANLGWQRFTDEVIKIINEKKDNVVFILWGNYARGKKALITNKTHLIIESTHPSPFSCNNGFFGSKPFSKTNKFLKEKELGEIDFRL